MYSHTHTLGFILLAFAVCPKIVLINNFSKSFHLPHNSLASMQAKPIGFNQIVCFSILFWYFQKLHGVLVMQMRVHVTILQLFAVNLNASFFLYQTLWSAWNCFSFGNVLIVLIFCIFNKDHFNRSCMWATK